MPAHPEAAIEARSKECVDSLVTTEGQARDGTSVEDAMRLQFSGIPLCDPDRVRLSEAFPDAEDFKATRRETGQALVREHLGLAKHLLKHDNRDGALFALKTVRRLVTACQLREPSGLDVLRARIAVKR